MEVLLYRGDFMSNDFDKYTVDSNNLNDGFDATAKECAFAMIADSHIDVHLPKRSNDLTAIYKYVTEGMEKQPDFFIHLGDMTECGFPHDYEAFTDLIPTAYRELYYTVPGNHEVRWDEWAGARYRALFGTGQYAFNKGGMHFIALNPTDCLIEAGYFTKKDLHWLKQDLNKLEPDIPVVIFLHYPIGDNNYFICNEDELFRVLDGHNVRAVFSGHVHQENKWEQNGMTMFSLPAVKNGPFFYWMEKKNNDNGMPVLSVYSGVVSQKERKPSLQLAAEIPLTGRKPAEFEKPVFMEFIPPKPDRSIATLSVALGKNSKAKSVQYQFWPAYTWAGKDTGTWEALYYSTKRGKINTWRTDLDLHDLPSGQYRLQIRVINHSDQKWDAFLKIIVPEANTSNRIKWSLDLQESIQADLVLAKGITNEPTLIIAATSHGNVFAVTPEGEVVWKYAAGGQIIGSPQYDNVHHLVIFGSTDHKFYALNASNGKKVWTYKTKQAILATPVIDQTQVIVPAGKHIEAIHITSGLLNWTTDINGFSGGMPAIDETAIYVGAGDGYVYALDKSTGVIRWKQALTIKEIPFRTLIYSSWATKAEIVPNEGTMPPILLVSTVEKSYGLHRGTGELIWQSDAANPYSSPLFYRDKDQLKAILVDDWGKITAVDPYSGVKLWQTMANQRIINTSPLAYGNLVYLIGVNGLLIGIDLLTGEFVDYYHLSTDCAYSTPVIFQSVLIQGGQDGILRCLTLR